MIFCIRNLLLALMMFSLPAQGLPAFAGDQSSVLAPSSRQAEELLLPARHKSTILKRFRNIMMLSLAAALAICCADSVTGWYIEIKTGSPSGQSVNWNGVLLDMLTGLIIWGLGDLAGQYLESGRNINKKRVLWLALTGIPLGFITYFIYFLAGMIPEISLQAVEKVPVLCAFIGNFWKLLFISLSGLVFTWIFTRIISHSKKTNTPEEKWKRYEVILLKMILAPFKTVAILALLPKSLQVPFEQIWDFYITVLSSFMMSTENLLLLDKIPFISKYTPSASA